MKRILLTAALACAALLASGTASARDVAWSVTIGSHGGGVALGVPVAPIPVYSPPVVYAPPVAYVGPPPVRYYAPRPVAYPVVVYGPHHRFAGPVHHHHYKAKGHWKHRHHGHRR